VERVSRRNGVENNQPDSHLTWFLTSQTGQEDSEKSVASYLG